MSIFEDIRRAVRGEASDVTSGEKIAPTPPGDRARMENAVPPGGAPFLDIEHALDSRSGADRLNWRTSLVDLLKLLGIPSDEDSRATLAAEMGRSNYDASPQDDRWLHEQILRALGHGQDRERGAQV